MNHRCFISFLLLFFSYSQLNGQQQVTGKVYAEATDSVIKSATVFNKNAKSFAYSGKDGSYSIVAAEGDTLIFSAAGYVPDTVTVQLHMLLTAYDVSLRVHFVSLGMVKVFSSYQLDSLNRRNYYKDIFKKQPGITGGNTPSNGVGVSLSPLSYFSKESKRKRVLKKRLIKEEHESYIDRSFPAEWVAKLTGLKDDSLNLFMYRYRPSYAFCRKTDRMQMVVYISDKLKEFRKPKVEP